MNSKEIITGPGKHIGTVCRDDQFAKYFDTSLYIVHFIQEKGPDVFEPWSYCQIKERHTLQLNFYTWTLLIYNFLVITYLFLIQRVTLSNEI